MSKTKKNLLAFICGLGLLCLSVPMVYAADGPIERGTSPRFAIKLFSDQGEFSAKNGLFFNGVEAGDELEGVIKLNSIDDIHGKYIFERSSAILENGKFGYYPVDVLDNPVGLGVWVDIDKNIVEYDGVGELEIPFTIHIPESVSPGDYYASVSGIFSGYLGDDLQKYLDLHPEKKKGNVAVRVASMVRLGLNIAGDIMMELVVKDLRWQGVALNEETNDNDLSISLDVLSKSTVIVQPIYKVKVFKGSEIVVEREVFTGTRLYTDDLTTEDLVIADVPEFGYGSYRVEVEVKYANQKDLFTWTVDQGSDMNFFLLAGKGEVSFWILPWLYIFMSFGLILLLLLILLLRNFLLKRARDKAVLYTVVEGDTFEIVIKKLGVEPKKVIKLNALKAPYFLQPGEQIFVPDNK
jgi:hypothetical protein